jgi:ABC-type bacteriocin/lantibiotic exporter with double-glycine peptidase domain
MDSTSEARPPAEMPTLQGAVLRLVRLAVLLRSHWADVIQGGVIGVAVALLGLVVPLLTKLLIDEVYPSQDISLLRLLVIGLFAVSAASTLFAGLQSFFLLWLNTNINNAVGLYFLNHLQHLPMRFFEERQVGEILSRFGDVRQSLQALQRILLWIVGRGPYLLFVPLLLFVLQWQLTVVALLVLPLTIGFIAACGHHLRKYWQRSAVAYADLAATQNEVLTQIRTIKSLALEAAVFRQAQVQIQVAIDAELSAGQLGQLAQFGGAILRSLTTALLTWLGWRLILAGEMTLGDYIAFTAYVGYLYAPLTELAGLFSDLQQSSVSLDRMFAYVDAVPEQRPANAAVGAPLQHRIHNGRIEFEDVSFEYRVGARTLTNITLAFPAGSTTAIVGASGSGKTTLLRLINRLETSAHGTIRIDGVTVGELPLADLRRQVASVWQEPGLLRGTVL